MKILKTLADGDVRVSDYCQITGKYRGSGHKDFDIKDKLNNENLFIFHNLTNYDSHLIMPELGKFKFKIEIITNG